MCKILNGGTTTEFLKKALEYIATSIKDLSRICSFSGQFTFANISMQNSPYNVLFPGGYYKGVYLFADDFDDKILEVSFFSLLLKRGAV
jgi:hypothetical protein